MGRQPNHPAGAVLFFSLGLVLGFGATILLWLPVGSAAHFLDPDEARALIIGFGQALLAGWIAVGGGYLYVWRSSTAFRQDLAKAVRSGTHEADPANDLLPELYELVHQVDRAVLPPTVYPNLAALEGDVRSPPEPNDDPSSRRERLATIVVLADSLSRVKTAVPNEKDATQKALHRLEGYSQRLANSAKKELVVDAQHLEERIEWESSLLMGLAFISVWICFSPDLLLFQVARSLVESFCATAGSRMMHGRVPFPVAAVFIGGALVTLAYGLVKAIGWLRRYLTLRQGLEEVRTLVDRISILAAPVNDRKRC